MPARGQRRGGAGAPTALGGAAEGSFMSDARLRVAVVAKLEDHKLVQKLRPFVAMPEIEELVLIRRRPLALDGVRNVCPPAAIADFTPLAETWRLCSTLRAVRTWPRER